MPNSRSISPEVWGHVRQALVFYFSRRHGLAAAEDLAQETITAILSRDDYEFAHEQDFPRVCLGFARHISQSAHRRRPTAGEESAVDVAVPAHHFGSAHATENGVLLDEIKRLAAAGLRDTEWQLILQSAGLPAGPAAAELHASDPNRFRVYLHRARRKLRALAGG